MRRPDPAQPSPSPVAAAAGATEALERLKELTAQLEAGSLTRAEYERLRGALLSRPPE